MAADKGVANSLSQIEVKNPIERFLSIQEICALTGASRATIWRWQLNATFPASVKIGIRKAAIPESAYRAWVASKRPLPSLASA